MALQRKVLGSEILVYLVEGRKFWLGLVLFEGM